MVQIVKSETIPPGHKKIIFEKPRVLRRIFIGIKALVNPDAWCESRVSFGDPMFYSYYTLAGYSKYFEAKGEGIFQGDVWLLNTTEGGVPYTMTEILV